MFFSQHDYCLICSSLNKLLVSGTDHAWECWNCNARYWIDDQSRLEIGVHYDIGIEMVDEILKVYLKESPVNLTNCLSGKEKFEDIRFLRNININFCMIESND